MSDTPKVDELLKEHRKFKSNTLHYPTEQALIQLARQLERELAAALAAKENK